MRRHRQNMVPPATALTQNKAICAAARHTAEKQRAIGSARSSHRRAAAAVESVQQRLQGLAYRVFAGVGPEGAGGHDTTGGKLQRGAEQEMSAILQLKAFVAAAAVFESAPRDVLVLRRRWLPREGRGSVQPHTQT
jgi:hypothetical protein